MNIDIIKKSIELNYDMEIRSIEKVKNSYKVETENSEYAVKKIKYDFNFIHKMCSIAL